MGGVDLSDACLTLYPSARKSLKKYYIKQFWHVLDMATFIAFILYQKCGGPMTRLTFILTLIDEAPLFLLIIEKHHSSYHATPTWSTITLTKPIIWRKDTFQTLFLRRLPTQSQHIVAMSVIRSRPESKTHYLCKECDKSLLAAPCFRIYHTVPWRIMPELDILFLFKNMNLTLINLQGCHILEKS